MFPCVAPARFVLKLFPRLWENLVVWLRLENSRMNRRWMKYLKRLGLALLAPVLFLGVAELALRMAGYGYPTAFFVPSEIQGRKVWIDNQVFGYRFFPPRLARTPPGLAFDREKRPGTIRAFVLGESAAMGDPLAEFGPARHLACLLEARYPGKRFEIVNAAMTAINSHAIVEIAREAARLQPDAFILYMGNNEVVGPYGPGTVFEAFSGSSLAIRARVLATRLRTSQWLRSALGPLTAQDAEAGAWSGLEMFAKRQLPADDPRLAAVHGRFRANVEKILAIARGAGAETILCTVAVNLRDCPPFAGPDARSLYSNACARAAAGEIDAARQAFELARDRDALRVRADGAINGILREIGTAGRPGVHFVDAEFRFQELGGIVPGEEYFLDHVHFNFSGNYELASELAAAMAELPALRAAPERERLSLAECRDRLLYTVWNELDLTEQSLQRIRQPPFDGQPGNAARIQALIRHREGLRSAMRSVDLDELRPVYLEAMRAHPDDRYYPAGWGAILYNVRGAGLYEEAERYLRAALALAPHAYDQRAALAMLLGFMGRSRDGIREILGPDRKGGLFPAQYLAQTGRVLTENGLPREASEFLKEAVRRDPRDARARQDLAACFVKLGELQEAEAELRAVLERQPDHAEAAEDLAFLLAVDGRWNDSLTLFRRVMAQRPDRPETRMKYALSLLHRGDAGEAVRELEGLRTESPDFAPGRFNLGLIYAKQRLWDAAAGEFETTAGLQPDNADAWFQLAQVRRMQGADSECRQALSTALRLEPERKEFLDGWNRFYPVRALDLVPKPRAGSSGRE